MVRSRWIGAVAGVLTCLAPSAFAQTMQPNEIVNVREGDKQARKCKVLKVSTDKDGSKRCEVEALDNGEKMTILEPSGGKGGARIFKNAPSFAGLFGLGSKSAPVTTTASAEPPLASANTVVTVAPTTPARPTDWRESWGKVEPWTDADAKKAAEAPSQRGPSAGRFTIPVAKAGAEPLAAPEQFTKIGLPSAVTPLPGPVVSTPAPVTPVAAATGTTPMPAPQVSEKKPGPVRSWLSGRFTFGSTSKEEPPTIEQPAAPARSWLPPLPATPGGKVTTVEKPADGTPLPPPMPRPRLGGGSVVAATEVVRPVKGKMPTLENAMSLPQTPAYVDPKGGANAFSAGTPNRPIPSDMGLADGTGAFGPRPGMMMAGPMPPIPPQPLPPGMRQQMMMAAMAQQQQAAMVQMAMAQQYQIAMAQQQAMAAAQRPSPTPKILADLRTSELPSEREMAVNRLRHADWKTEPEVLQGLTEAAKADPAPTVRMACIRVLGQMRADTFPVIQTLEQLKQDRDPRVRQEAYTAVESLSRKK
jgi:hypothetical protein